MIDDNEPRILGRDACERIVQRTKKFAQPGGTTEVRLEGWWNGEQRWARNRTALASDRRDIRLTITRELDGHVDTATTNQLDDASLEATMRSVERSARLEPRRLVPEIALEPPPFVTPNTAVWSDATYQFSAEQRGTLAHRLMAGAEARGMLSAGYLEMRVNEVASLDAKDVVRYVSFTQAQCSMTVRHPKGVGSGWAGSSSYDWSTIDVDRLATTAVDKCIASLDPVRVEPGRYTVILEPQAVLDLAELLVSSLNRSLAQMGLGPWALKKDEHIVGLWHTKLGMKVLDPRVTIDHDPVDTTQGIVPYPGLTPVTWIRNGVLESMSYFEKFVNNRYASLAQLNENLPVDERLAFRMSGGAVSVDDMVKSTERGLLVTRFSGVMSLSQSSLMCTGVTRDGLWLIENGVIAKPVKNMRFVESPLFVFNQIEQLGVPVPVFRPIKDPYTSLLSPTIVPPIKAKDFSFNATADAV